MQCCYFFHIPSPCYFNVQSRNSIKIKLYMFCPDDQQLFTEEKHGNCTVPDIEFPSISTYFVEVKFSITNHSTVEKTLYYYKADVLILGDNSNTLDGMGGKSICIAKCGTYSYCDGLINMRNITPKTRHKVRQYTIHRIHTSQPLARESFCDR